MQRLIRNFLIGGITLTACSAALPTRPPTPVPSPRLPIGSPSVPPPPSAAPALSTATGTPLPTTPGSAEACAERSGSVIYEEAISAQIIRPLPFHLYLPPCFDREEGDGYPALILLHGLTGHPDQWLEMGLVSVADDLISSGQASPFLIAIPWLRTGIEPEPAVVEVLLPVLMDEYAARESRAELAIGGISRGAGWSLRIGFKHSDLFGSIGLHSPAVLAGDLTSLGRWSQSIAHQDQPRLWIDIGERDSLRPSAEELSNRLDELDLSHHFQMAPGDHSPDYWSRHLRSYLAWYAERW